MPSNSCYAIIQKDGSGNILQVFRENADEESLKQQLSKWLSLDFNDDLILGDKDDKKANCFLTKLEF